MPAYYNEFDPGAAAWLRELRKAQGLPENSASDREARGMLDKEPKPYPAIHSSSNSCVRHGAQTQSCVQRQEPGFLRMTDNILARSGSSCKTEPSCLLAAASSSSSHDKSPLAAVGECERCERILLPLPGGSHRSKAICYIALDLLGNWTRKFCSRDASQDLFSLISSCIVPCTSTNNTSGEYDFRAFLSRTQRSEVAQ